MHFPDSPGLRPTPDRIRETLFNWLQGAVPGARCLDLFAGSGALGLEALSRGASAVVFVEQAPEPARMLAAELARLAGPEAVRGRIVQSSAERFLAAPAARLDPGGPSAAGQAAGDAPAGSVAQPFDVVFLDPPFAADVLTRHVERLDAGGWVRRGGWIYLEAAREAGLPRIPPRWELVKSKSAGEVGYHLARVLSS